ncbi:MAG: pyridoxamine 5'-phosphate oxidase [Actinomycetota bacterium]|nr:pyridoxamine 5'-phosphate oxidase [Actinomycetota bacterium]
MSSEQQPSTAREVLARLRREYGDSGLHEDAAGDEPYALFDRWLGDAVAAHEAGALVEPNAMVLATVAADGSPSVRIVLLKGMVDGGLVFYSNYESRKGRELAADPRCALTLLWHDLQRQVRVEGVAQPVEDQVSDTYFASRPRGSQLGAWASPQSRVVADRAELEASYEALERRFGDEQPVPRPPHWGGWRVVPQQMEFWHGRPGRMHDRLRFVRTAGSGWRRDRLAP